MEVPAERLIFPFQEKTQNGVFEVSLRHIHQAAEVYMLGSWYLQLDLISFKTPLKKNELLELISPNIKTPVGGGSKGVYPTIDNLACCFLNGDDSLRHFYFANSKSERYCREINIKTDQLRLEFREPHKDNRPVVAKEALLRGHIWIPL